MAVKSSNSDPPSDNDILPVVRDAATAAWLVLVADRERLVRCFFYVPLGIFAALAIIFGVDRLLNIGNVSFPASVACLLLLFFFLLLCDWILGEKRTKKLVRVINVPGGWSLRWLNIFFTPAFVMLPLSPSISGTEVGKIIAVFVIGFVVMFVFGAYMTRAIQLLLSTPRKIANERPTGDAHQSQENIELASLLPRLDAANGSTSGLSSGQHTPPAAPPQSHAAAYITIRGQNLDDPLSSFSDVVAPHPHLVVPHSHSGTQLHRLHHQEHLRQQTQYQQRLQSLTQQQQQALDTPRSEQWADWLATHGDVVFFTAVLFLVGIPVYYASGADYPMPLHLMINILMFRAAMALPASWRRLLHPVLVSAFVTLLILWLLGRIHNLSLAEVLHTYRTGTTYVQVWAGTASPGETKPGAGDMLASTLDVSIMALALPMYQYRHELRRYFWAIVLPNIVMSVASLFAYPVVCYHIGISPERSLAFTSRSLTLALATPTVRNLGGDLNTVAAVAIISGVLGVLIGRQLLTWMRIPEDDYVTRGVTFGANASALGTALLLRTDPRAAALSSLAMSLFGTVTVVFSSIPPMVHIIRSLVGLS